MLTLTANTLIKKLFKVWPRLFHLQHSLQFDHSITIKKNSNLQLTTVIYNCMVHFSYKRVKIKYCKRYVVPSLIAHLQLALGLRFKIEAKCKTIHMDISFICMKENSFSYEWFCTWPRFEKRLKATRKCHGLLKRCVEY